MIEVHPEELIREAIVNILLGNPQPANLAPIYPLGDVKDNVFSNRPTPAAEDELPGVFVYAKTTFIESEKDNVTYLSCEVRGIIEIVVEETDDVDKVIDRLAIKILNLLSGNSTLIDPVLYAASLLEFPNDTLKAREAGRTCNQFKIQGEYNKELMDGGKQIIGSGKLNFVAKYEYEIPPDTETGIFDTLKVDYELAEDNNTAREAQDNITGIHQED